MDKEPKKSKSIDNNPCLGKIDRAHRLFTIQVQILNTHFTKFRQNYGFQAQHISKFEKDCTNFDPPILNPTWLYNFAPEDLY